MPPKSEKKDDTLRVVEQRPRIGYIDGCRALALTAVVVYHGFSHAGWAYRMLDTAGQMQPSALMVLLFSQGAHGVDLFFVISGFCLSYPTLSAYYKTGTASFSIDRFLAKRFVRIVPPYYAALALCVIAVWVLQASHIPVPTAINPNMNVWDILRQMLFLDRGTRLANGAFWTLFVEFRWYLLFPFLLVLWMRSKRAYMLGLFIIVIAYQYTRARSLDLGVLPAFMLGIVAADWQIREYSMRKYALLFMAVAFDIALLLEPFASVPNTNGFEEHGLYAQSNIGWHFTCFFFVVAAGTWKPLRRLLESRVPAFIGAASYSIYLVHQPIIAYFSEQTVGTLGKLGSFAAGCTVCMVVGSIFWLLIERRFYHGDAVYERLAVWLQEKLAVGLHFSGVARCFSLSDAVQEKNGDAVVALE